MYAEIDTLIWYTRNSTTVLWRSTLGKRLFAKHIWTFQIRWMFSFVFIFHSLLIFIDLKMVLLETGKTVAKSCTTKSNLLLRSQVFAIDSRDSREKEIERERKKKLQVLVDVSNFAIFPKEIWW